MVVKKNTLAKEVGSQKNRNIGKQSKNKMIKGGQADSSIVYKNPINPMSNDAYPLMSQTNDFKPVEQLTDSVQNSVDNYYLDRVMYSDAKYFQAGKKINAHWGVADIPNNYETKKGKTSNYIVGGDTPVAVPVATARIYDKSALPNGGTTASNIRNSQQSLVFSGKDAQAPTPNQIPKQHHTVLPYVAMQNSGTDARAKLDGGGYFGGGYFGGNIYSGGVLDDGGFNDSTKNMNKPMNNNYYFYPSSTKSVTSRNLGVGHRTSQPKVKDNLGIGITRYKPEVMAGGSSNINYQNWW
jgi:hypothetical protein